MSAAARQRIAVAQRKRWAAAKKESGVMAEIAKPVAYQVAEKGFLMAGNRQNRLIVERGINSLLILA
jgi:hypothetical protein